MLYYRNSPLGAGQFAPEMLSYDMPFNRRTALHARRGGLHRARYWQTQDWTNLKRGALGYASPPLARVLSH